jgi:ArsR family transcriptional regulator
MDLYIEQFKALGDKKRLAILWLLNSVPGDLCVCEITDAIGESHCNVSRHLKILKEAKLVKEKKEGRWVYFGLMKPQERIQECLLQAMETIPAERFSRINERLKLRLSLRSGGRCVDGVKSDRWQQVIQFINGKEIKETRINAENP